MSNVVSLLFGSEKDINHVKRVVQRFDQLRWQRGPNGSYPIPTPQEGATHDGQIRYSVWAGSVHRDHDGTIHYVETFRQSADRYNDRLIFVTCIGLQDDASGTIASKTGTRVVALPPDRKPYQRYPKGIPVTTFGGEEDRHTGIIAASEWIEREFKNPEWNAIDDQNKQLRKEGRSALDVLRDKLWDNGIEL